MANDPSAHPVMAVLDTAIHAFLLRVGAAMSHNPGYSVLSVASFENIALKNESRALPIFSRYGGFNETRTLVSRCIQ